MNRYSCEKETKVLEALGSWDADLRAHVKDCPHCSDVVMVAKFLQQEAEVEPTLPKAEFIWWKSQLMARHRTVKQVTRPITWAGNLACLTSGLTLLWFLFASREGAVSPLKLEAFWTGDLAVVVLLGSCVAVLCALLGSAYLVLVEK